MTLVVLFSLLSMLYCCYLGWLYRQWRLIPCFVPRNTDRDIPFVTVIIPVRNEAANILALLQDLSQQQLAAGIPFPENRLEVIVVDDFSEDATPMLVQQYQRQCSYHLRLMPLSVPKGFAGSHKKMAITQAVKASRGEIIVTTDGDCRVGTCWLSALTRYFKKKQAALLSGPVTFHQESNIWHRLQTIEFASLIAAGAGSLQAHTPNMCNGANLAFSRKVFEEVNGYAGSMHIPSGDDEFLMQKIFRRYPHKVFFIKSREAVVYTFAKDSLGDFYQQRRRWAGKWKRHQNKKIALLAVSVFIYHLVFLTALFMTLLQQYSWLLLLLQVFPRLLLEYLLLRDVLRLMKKKMQVPNFILLECIYSAYVVFFGITANFGGYSWKNRSYS